MILHTLAGPPDPKTIPLAGFQIAALDRPGFLDYCRKKIESRQPCWIVTLNLEMVSRCRLNKAYGDVLKHADLLVADGMPLVWGSRSKRRMSSLPERLAGADLTEELLHLVPACKIAIIGGREPKRALQKLGIDDDEPYIFPDKVDATEEQAERFAEELNSRGSELVFLALGVPKQDYLAALLRPKLKQGILIGVGGTFEMISGTIKRAPVWMRRSGLEWMYRLIQEPRRLAYRYLVLYWVGAFTLAADVGRSWLPARKKGS